MFDTNVVDYEDIVKMEKQRRDVFNGNFVMYRKKY